MAFGKIVADEIENSSAGALDTKFVVNGSAKAWANYSQTDATVRDSFSISSVTDDSTGVHTYVFTNNMSNANWAAGFIGRNNRQQWNTNEGATTGRAVRTADSNNTVGDQHSNTIVCMGDLA